VPKGIPGSTLVAELNRLANGGTYPPIEDYVDEAAAARAWATARGITSEHKDTVGVLNDIAGITGGANNHLDYNGVCNLIAGTTWLTANVALQGLES
jgi:hypothetical protein